MRKLFSLLFLVLSLGVFARPAEAKVIMQESGSVVIGEDEVIVDDLWIGAETVEIAGKVEGDVFVGAGVVRFSGKTTGDLIIGAGEVSVTGEVGDDLWIGAGNAYVMGATIGDGMMVGAGSVTVDDESSVGGSLLAGAGMLDNKAPVGRNLMAGAGTLRVDAPVGGEMKVGGEMIELGPRTRVEGDFTYMSEGEASLAEGAMVAGQTRRMERKYPDHRVQEQEMMAFWRSAKKGMELFSFLGAMVVGLVAVWLLRKPTVAIAAEMQKNMLASLGWGLLVVVLAGPALLMLSVTGIGLPLAMVLGLLLVVDFYMAKVWVAMATGQVMQKRFGWKKMQVGWVYVVGLAVYYVARNIPWVGGLVRLVSFLAGVGGMMLYLKNSKK